VICQSERQRLLFFFLFISLSNTDSCFSETSCPDVRFLEDWNEAEMKTFCCLVGLPQLVMAPSKLLFFVDNLERRQTLLQELNLSTENRNILWKLLHVIAAHRSDDALIRRFLNQVSPLSR
jgi:hypothetical protein